MNIFFLSDIAWRDWSQAYLNTLLRCSWRLPGGLCISLLFPVWVVAGPKVFAAPSASSDLASSPADPSATLPGAVPHVTAERNGVLTTSDGLTLRLITDLGSVHIVPLENGAAPVVRYVVRIETDARAPLATALLESYALKTRSSSGCTLMWPYQPATTST